MDPPADSPPLIDWTPRDVQRAAMDLSIYCGACLVLRDVDVARLVKARPDQKLAQMVFRCGKCGGLGSAFLSWRGDANEHRSFDFARGLKRRDM